MVRTLCVHCRGWMQVRCLGGEVRSCTLGVTAKKTHSVPWIVSSGVLVFSPFPLSIHALKDEMLCTGGGKGSGQAARARQCGLRGSPLDTGSRAEHLVAGMTRENDAEAGPVRIPEQSPNRLQMGFCAFLLELQTVPLHKLSSAYRLKLSLTLSRSPRGARAQGEDHSGEE